VKFENCCTKIYLDHELKYENSPITIFIVGEIVDDFLTVDKAKIWALNFSATQEIDRQQQADKVKIATLESENQELKTKVSTLESELASIKQHLGI
jgi:hypothetical protein